MHTYIHAQMHTYIHTYLRTYIHTYIQPWHSGFQTFTYFRSIISTLCDWFWQIGM